MLVGSWSCRTTQAGGLIQPEEDRIEQIGNGPWLHGTSRPLEGRSEPVYDFYVGYEGSHWVYIQIYPSANFYFVGISDGSSLTPSSWQIAYPVRLAGYRFEIDGRFVYDSLPRLDAVLPERTHAVALGQSAAKIYNALLDLLLGTFRRATGNRRANRLTARRGMVARRRQYQKSRPSRIRLQSLRLAGEAHVDSR